MFSKISLAVLCLISNVQAADSYTAVAGSIPGVPASQVTTVAQDLRTAEAAVAAAGSAAAMEETKVAQAVNNAVNGHGKMPVPPSTINIPNVASPKAQQSVRNLERSLGRYVQQQGDKTGRALEPSLRALDTAAQSARVRTAGAIAQILRPATSAFALFVDKMGPGKNCNVPAFYDCWMKKEMWERDRFLLQGECANKSGCNVRDDKAAMQKIGQSAQNVGGILEQLDKQIQQEFQAAAEAAERVIQKESETWCRGVMDIVTSNFKCEKGCVEKGLERMGPNTNPGMLADKCKCQPPFETTQNVQQLIGMTTKDFYLVSAEEYVSMVDGEPNQEVLLEDLDEEEEEEEELELQDAAQAAKDAAAAGVKAAADAAAANGNDAAAQQIKDAAAAAGAAPAAGAEAPAAGADAGAAAGADATAGAKSTTQKMKDALVAAKNKAKSNPTVTIIIIVVVVLLLIAVGAFFYFRSSGKEEENNGEGGDMEVADLYRRLM